jgi:dimeric dUTPase (all-alpha-NTP-PPase superfamily)
LDNILEQVSFDGTTDRLECLIKKQTQLMHQFHPIERNNGHFFLEEYPIRDLKNRFSQARLREFAGRITEEMAESVQAFGEKRDGTENHMDRFYEELIDALHFLLEFTILSGFGLDRFDVLPPGRDYLDRIAVYLHPETTTMDDDEKKEYYADRRRRINPDVVYRRILTFITKLWMTINLLKNKPWKQSLKEVDSEKFFTGLRVTWLAFFGVCTYAGLSPEAIFDTYLSKHGINQNRIDTGV